MNKRLNICFFSGDITRSGGTERVALLIANELCKNSEYNISIVSMTERNEKTFFKKDESIQTFRLYDKVVKGIVYWYSNVKRLRDIVKHEKIDMLIDIDGILDMYSVPVKWSTNVKVISWEHFNIYNHPSAKVRKIVRKLAVKHVDAIVTLTEQDKEYHLKELSFKCPIQAIHNPVIYTGADNQYDTQSKIIISVGRLTHQKGFDRLIPIAKVILNKHKDWEWIILGEGEDREIIEKKIKENNLTNRLKLLGNVSDIETYYSSAAIFVMTSRYEGLPMTLLEAKYHQLPIVSYDIKTGPQDCILEGVNGYLITDNDFLSFSDRIEELIENKEKRSSFSRHALDDTEKFSIKKIISQWEKLIGLIVN